MQKTEVVVIGGGIAGCSAAYEFARLGAKVTLFEQYTLAFGASGRNMGHLTNSDDFSARLATRMSIKIYQELLGGDIDFELRELDKLLIAAVPAQVPKAQATIEDLKGIGEELEQVSSSWIDREFGGLNLQISEAWVMKGAWAMHPGLATRAFAESARNMGANIHTNTRVAQIVVEGGRVTGVVTDMGRVAADVVIIANGVWVPDLLPEIPITSTRGWLLRTTPLSYRVPMMLQELWPSPVEFAPKVGLPTVADIVELDFTAPTIESLIVTPQPSGELILGASAGNSLRNMLEGSDMPKRVSRQAIKVAPGLATAPIRHTWSGLRPMSPDGIPIAGRLEAEGLYINGGHGFHGMLFGPITARLIAKSVNEGKMVPELAPYSPMRFAERLH